MADLSYLREHFNPEDPALVGEGELLGDAFWDAVDTMVERCPVTPTDRSFIGLPEGGWIVSGYAEVMEVIGDPARFSSQIRRGAADEPVLIPMDLDPPLLLEYRQLLSPFLSLRAVAPFAPLARQIVSRLLDDVVPAGECDDLIARVCYPFASEIQWGWLVGVDDFDRDRVLEWVIAWTHKHFEPEYAVAEREWHEWTKDVIARRRAGPRRDDLIDALLHGSIKGRPLSDDEAVGIMMIMIIGGVTTTADAIGNILLRLAVTPTLQQRLRDEPKLLPRAIEELLRVESPALGPARRCTRDTELGGHTIRAGEQLFVHLAAANRDPARFEHAREVDVERRGNPHLAFGAGHHRCLGVTFARQNLRVVLEEMLARMDDIHLPSGDAAERLPGIVWGLKRLPLAFTPRERTSAATVTASTTEQGA
jgi:cytochrome P450